MLKKGQKQLETPAAGKGSMNGVEGTDKSLIFLSVSLRFCANQF